MRAITALDTPLSRLFNQRPHCQSLWPTKQALDAQLYRLFSDGSGSGSWQQYQPYHLRIAVIHRLLKSSGVCVTTRGVSTSNMLRGAIEDAIWSELDHTVTIELIGARIVLDVPVTL
jgi:hypothetical protein